MALELVRNEEDVLAEVSTALKVPAALLGERIPARGRRGCSCGRGVLGGGRARVMAHSGSESVLVGHDQRQAGVAEQV